MDLFTYLMAKNGHNTSIHEDLFSYLLGKSQGGGGEIKTVTGITIFIPDAKKLVSFMMTKESSQKTTEGYNIFPSSLQETKTSDGITVTSDGKGTYTINGTATANTYIYFDLIDEFTIPYSISGNGQGKFYMFNDFVNSNVSLYLWNNTTIVDSWVFNALQRTSSNYYAMSGKVCNKISVYVSQDTTITNAKFSLMITNDGNTTHDFEEYTGGQPSPNPDYPQEVKTVKGYENLFNKIDYTTITLGSNGGVTYTKMPDKISFTIPNSGTNNGIYITKSNINSYIDNYNDNTQYYLSLDIKASRNMTMKIGGDTRPSDIEVETTKKRIIVQTSFGTNGLVFYTISGNQSGDIVEISNIMIAYEDNPYVPYGNNYVAVNVSNGTITNKYPIPLNNNEIVGIGDYKDELKVDKSGHVFINKKTKKYIFDGTENWMYELVSGERNNFYLSGLVRGIRSAGMFNNIGNFSEFLTKNYDCFINRSVLNYLCNEYTNANDFKNLLSNQNMIVYYVLETPELIDLQTTVDLSLFKGVNNVSNSEDGYMTIEYK